MILHRQFLFILTAIVFIFFACNRKTGSLIYKDYSAWSHGSVDTANILGTIRKNQQFEYLQTKGKVIIQHDETNYESNLLGYLVSDSATMFTAKDFGLEWGRLLLNNHQFLILDRISKKLTTGSLQKFFDLPLAWTQLMPLQQMITCGFHLPRNYSYLFSVQKENIIISGGTDQESLQLVVARNNLLPISFSVTRSDFVIHTQMSNYQLIDQRYCPSTISIKATDMIHHQSSHVHLEWDQMDHHPISKIKFIVPEHYERIEL